MPRASVPATAIPRYETETASVLMNRSDPPSATCLPASEHEAAEDHADAPCRQAARRIRSRRRRASPSRTRSRSAARALKNTNAAACVVSSRRSSGLAARRRRGPPRSRAHQRSRLCLHLGQRAWPRRASPRPARTRRRRAAGRSRCRARRRRLRRAAARSRPAPVKPTLMIALPSRSSPGGFSTAAAEARVKARAPIASVPSTAASNDHQPERRSCPQ